MRRLCVAALVAALFAIPYAFGDEGMRSLPKALLALDNLWSGYQTAGKGVTVSGNPGSILGNGTAGCHIAWSGGGFVTCYDGAVYRTFNVDASSLTIGAYNPAMSFAFQGSGGFKIANSPVGMGKFGSVPAAPGAGAAQLYWTAGTNAGTCKLVAMAGTSTTPATVLDNVGGGC